MIQMRYKVVEVRQVLSGQVTCILQYTYDKAIAESAQIGTQDTVGSQITLVITNPKFAESVQVGGDFIISAESVTPLPTETPPVSNPGAP